jgi:hypothetical protein
MYLAILAEYFCLRSPEPVDSMEDYSPSVRRMLRPPREYMRIYPPDTKEMAEEYLQPFARHRGDDTQIFSFIRRSPQNIPLKIAGADGFKRRLSSICSADATIITGKYTVFIRRMQIRRLQNILKYSPDTDATAQIFPFIRRS